MPNKDQDKAKTLAKTPGKAKLLASLEKVPAADRARMGITQADVEAAAETKTGVAVETSQWQADEDEDLEEQVRVIDHDSNRVLFSGTKAEYARLKKAVTGQGG